MGKTRTKRKRIRPKTKKRRQPGKRDRIREKSSKTNFFKTMFFNYLKNFPKKFLKNCALALGIFLIVFIVSQLNLSWNESFMDYIYKVSAEGIDFSDISFDYSYFNNLF